MDTQANLTRPIILADSDSIYAVCGVDQDPILSSSDVFVNGSPIGASPDIRASNYGIYELGLGGAIDRSSEDEDRRIGASRYVSIVKGGAPITRNLYVYRDDKQPLTVKSVEDPSGMFETEIVRQTDSKWEIKVTVAGETPVRTVRGSLVITTDAEKGARVAVPYEVPGEADE